MTQLALAIVLLMVTAMMLSSFFSVPFPVGTGGGIETADKEMTAIATEILLLTVLSINRYKAVRRSYVYP